MRWSKRITAVALALAFVAMGCGKPDGSGGSLPRELVGYWKTEPWLSQLGIMVDYLCLEGDGSFAEVLHTIAGPFEDAGTYRVESGVLIRNGRETTRSEYRLEGGTLILAVEDSELIELVYEKAGKRCPKDITVAPDWQSIADGLESPV